MTEFSKILFNRTAELREAIFNAIEKSRFKFTDYSESAT
jgi:hypothetical protein